MRQVAIVLVLTLVVCPFLFAQGRGKGHDHGRSDKTSVEKAGERIVDEAVDAVTDELVGEGSSSTRSGGMPPGLSKKGKTPPGWSKGKKVGWDKDSSPPKRDSWVRRLIRGIFRGGQAAQ